VRWIVVLTIPFIFWLAPLVDAVSVNISNIPSSVTDQPFSIDVSVASASAGTNYLRANLFPTGTTSYFGYTYNGSDYINSSNYSEYFPITIPSSGSWSGTIQAKLDSASSHYSGPGSYSLKVRRYTQSGSSYTWSNEVLLSVDFTLPTPSPSESPSPTPSSSPSPSASASTSSSKTTKTTASTTPAKSSSPTPTPSTKVVSKTEIEDKPLSQLPDLSSIAGVASESTEEEGLETKLAGDSSFNWKKVLGIVVLLTGLGAGVFVWKSS
jgi:hypothetical protein